MKTYECDVCESAFKVKLDTVEVRFLQADEETEDFACIVDICEDCKGEILEDDEELNNIRELFRAFFKARKKK